MSRPQPLKAKFQIGSAHARVGYEMSEKVFHESDMPARAKESRAYISNLMTVNTEADGRPRWSYKASSGNDARGGPKASWDDNGWDDRYYNAIETKHNVERAREKMRETIRAARETVKALESDPSAWNNSTLVTHPRVGTLSTSPTDADQVTEMKRKTLSKVNSATYRRPEDRVQELIEQKRQQKLIDRLAEQRRQLQEEPARWSDFPTELLEATSPSHSTKRVSPSLRKDPKDSYSAALLADYLQNTEDLSLTAAMTVKASLMPPRTAEAKSSSVSKQSAALDRAGSSRPARSQFTLTICRSNSTESVESVPTPHAYRPTFDESTHVPLPDLPWEQRADSSNLQRQESSVPYCPDRGQSAPRHGGLRKWEVRFEHPGRWEPDRFDGVDSDDDESSGPAFVWSCCRSSDYGSKGCSKVKEMSSERWSVMKQ